MSGEQNRRGDCPGSELSPTPAVPARPPTARCPLPYGTAGIRGPGAAGCRAKGNSTRLSARLIMGNPARLSNRGPFLMASVGCRQGCQPGEWTWGEPERTNARPGTCACPSAAGSPRPAPCGTACARASSAARPKQAENAALLCQGLSLDAAAAACVCGGQPKLRQQGKRAIPQRNIFLCWRLRNAAYPELPGTTPAQHGA